MTRRRMPTTRAAVTVATLGAGTTYFALVFAAGFALGTVRTLVVAPVTGDAGAVALELPIILAISWVACGWVLQRFAVPDRASARLAMGALAFLLLMAAEALVSVGLFGRDLASHLALYRNTPEIVGLSGQIIFALIPLFRTRGKAGVSNISTTTQRPEATAGRRGTWWRRIGLFFGRIGLLVFGATYWSEVRATRERLSAGSQIVQTRHGAIPVGRIPRAHSIVRGGLGVTSR